MYSQSGAINFKRLLRIIKLFVNRAQTCKRAEMARVQRQRPGDIRDGGAKLPSLIISGGAGIPTLREVGGMVRQSGKVFDRFIGLACCQGPTPSLQQQIH